jgi:hypothetical protein
MMDRAEQDAVCEVVRPAVSECDPVVGVEVCSLAAGHCTLVVVVLPDGSGETGV